VQIDVVSALMRVPGVARVRRAVEARARAAWSADRARMAGAAALGNQVFRIAVMAVRGIIAHRLELLAAALTYYTVFAIVPTLAVVLSIVRMFDYLPVVAAEVPSAERLPEGNDLIREVLRQILDTVSRTNEVATGLVGLGVLLFAVSKMFRQTERALHIIAGPGRATPRFSRMIGYVALLLMAPTAVAISGLFFALSSGRLRNAMVRSIGSIAGFELSLGTALAFVMLWLAVAVFYWSAVRARIPFRSAAVGAALAAVSLPVVFWAFATFQVGVAQESTLGSGFLAVPVFLLWVSASWGAVLVGAEVAVAHRADRVLLHGLAAYRLDAVGELQACASIMVCVTRAAGTTGTSVVTEDDLARTLRLPPEVIATLCLRLVGRGLLVEQAGGYALGCDPGRTDLAAVIEAAQRDPDLEPAHVEALARLSPRAQAVLRGRGGSPSGAADTSVPSLAELARESP
jgi:membrane protein